MGLAGDRGDVGDATFADAGRLTGRVAEESDRITIQPATIVAGDVITDIDAGSGGHCEPRLCIVVGEIALHM